MNARACPAAGRLVSVLLALLLAACGPEPNPGSSPPPGAAARPESKPDDSRAAAPTALPHGGAAFRTVRDMRGVDVHVPADITRVATIDDGLVESVMIRLGVIRSLVALGSSSQQRVWSYSYPSRDGSSYTVADGMGTARVLHPWLADLPCASRTSGDAINFETIAGARPQVAILRVGDCTLGTAADGVGRAVGMLEALGVAVVVLRSPTDHAPSSLETLGDEIMVLGRLFGKEAEAEALAKELSSVETMIAGRSEGVPEASRPRALYLGLASGARSSGGAAYVWGRGSAESWMLEGIVGARNAYEGAGARVLLGAEQLLALDPDVIFLPTSAGYHPPRELTEAPYFRDLQRLRAVREGRVYALPWSPMNCARRLEYPVELMIMAKGSYPEQFADIAVHDWVLAFFRGIYGVDDEQARALRRAQWLEWMVESGF